MVTGRTLKQGESLEAGKFADEYSDAVAICELSPEDMDALGIEDGQPVRVSTAHGAVVVGARRSKNVGVGVFFIPYGLWANLLVSTRTRGTGMPTYKGLEALVQPAPGQNVPTLFDIMRSLEGKET
ncbi:MAG: molybdopterin dinucleotide binding domain-containing protein [Nitrososphaeria archaeon]